MPSKEAQRIVELASSKLKNRFGIINEHIKRSINDRMLKRIDEERSYIAEAYWIDESETLDEESRY